MSRRRSRGDQLTGGAGDVNPQILHIPQVVTSPANLGLVQSKIPLPTQRLTQRAGKSLVMEVLRIWYDFGWPFTGNAGAFVVPSGTTAFQAAFVATRQVGALSANTGNNSDGAVISFVQNEFTPYYPAGGPNFIIPNPTLIDELTDEAGHGVLVATDAIYIGLWGGGINAGQVSAATVNVAILYRWKEVTLEEYIGIVQSQS